MHKDTIEALKIISEILAELSRMYGTVRENDYINTRLQYLDKIVNKPKEEKYVFSIYNSYMGERD